MGKIVIAHPDDAAVMNPYLEMVAVEQGVEAPELRSDAAVPRGTAYVFDAEALERMVR